MRVSSTASANFSGVVAKPGASTPITCGIKISAISVSSESQSIISVPMRSAISRAAARPSAANTPAKAGTKAALKAPSPNRRRNRLGSLSATKNASATGPAPRREAISMSRAKPRIRLAMVQLPMVSTERSIEGGVGGAAAKRKGACPEGVVRLGEGLIPASVPNPSASNHAIP